MKTEILIDHTGIADPLPTDNKAQHSQWFGVYDTQGKLRATFDSEPEAYFYIRNRGHVNGGTYKAIVNHADKLAEALRDSITSPGALAEKSHEYALRRLKTITEAATYALAAYESEAAQ